VNARGLRDHAHVATIEIRGLAKRFGSVEAVRDLSFDVEAGGFAAGAALLRGRDLL
jgi:ABC-type sugar transport system ATPase subunit